jgi:hypothetical protein
MRRLAEWFGRKPSRGAAPEKVTGDGAAPYYVQADGGARVELVAHARSAGLENLPESDAMEPNDVEAAVEHEHTRRHRDLIEQTRAQLRTLTAEFDRHEQQIPATKDLDVAVEQSRATIEHALATDDRLIPLRQAQQRRRRDLRGFVRDHQLTQPARYPASRLFHVGMLAALLVAESVLNMGFFVQTNSLGLAGGFIVAVAVSLTNIALGLAAGFFCLRWRNHREARLRRLATAGVVLYGLLTLLFNLGVAHLRDQTASAGAGTELHVDQVLRHPFSLTFASAVLFVVGVLASLIAARKGFTLDSATPGHGDVDRRFKAADEDFGGHQQALRQRILGEAEAVPELCRRIVRQAEETLEQLGQIVVQAERGLEGYEAERERLARWCHQWLRKYRSENEAVRTTPAPGYFSRLPEFPSEVDGQPVEKLKDRFQLDCRRLEELKVAARRICLDQSGRVEAARGRFEGFLQEALRRADTGRGEGSGRDAGVAEPGGGLGS